MEVPRTSGGLGAAPGRIELGESATCLQMLRIVETPEIINGTRYGGSKLQGDERIGTSNSDR